MRTINEVIIAVLEQQPCTDEELRLTLLAVSSMELRLDRSIRELAEAVVDNNRFLMRFKAGFELAEHVKRFDARKMPADEYLGPDHMPGTPENKRLVQMGKNLLKKATGIDWDAPPTKE